MGDDVLAHVLEHLEGVLWAEAGAVTLVEDLHELAVDGSVFDGIKAAIVKDRYAYFKDFFDNSYNTDKLAPDRISEPAIQASFNVAANASPYASYACVDTWLTDFRADVPKIDVPTLVVHGTEDRILPHESTARAAPCAHPRTQARHGRGRPELTTSAGRTTRRSTGR